MKVVSSLCFFLVFSVAIFAQDLVLTPIGESFCRPGVTNKSPGKGLVLEYGINPNIQLRSENATALSGPTKVGINQHFKAKLKLPVLNKEKIKVLIGWNYYGEKYNFDQIGQTNASIFNTIDNKHLKSSRLSVYLIRPINHKYYYAVKAVASSNGDYQGAINFEKRYTNYDVATIFGVKKQSNIEWGVGLLLRKNFLNSFPVVPFGIYNHTFNAKWGIETTIPTSLMTRYNFSPTSLLKFGPQFDSRSYSIDIFENGAVSSDPYTMRRSELRFSMQYERNIKSWLWMSASAGYIRNFTTRFQEVEKGQDPEIVRVNPSNGPFFRFGIFLSPPIDKYCK